MQGKLCRFIPAGFVFIEGMVSKWFILVEKYICYEMVIQLPMDQQLILVLSKCHSICYLSVKLVHKSLKFSVFVLAYYNRAFKIVCWRQDTISHVIKTMGKQINSLGIFVKIMLGFLMECHVTLTRDVVPRFLSATSFFFLKKKTSKKGKKKKKRKERERERERERELVGRITPP
jgi:hypothetical protein